MKKFDIYNSKNEKFIIFNIFPHKHQMDAKDCGPVYQLPSKSYGKLKMPQTVQNYSEDSLRHFCV